MLPPLPQKLQTADSRAFAKRAAQLEKIKPAISYWCYYQVVNYILRNSLHTQDAECTTYTTALLDKLEEMKQEYPLEDTISDDMAAQAYVEQFGIETLQRAKNTMDANKVSSQTADTFLASATFLELLQTWAPLTQEIAAKIKFAKYHALRIVKAVKAGQDPNASNPIKETESIEEEVAPLDPNDPEVQAINGTSSVHEQPSALAASETQNIPGIIRTTTSGMSPFKDQPADQKSLGAPSPLQQNENARNNSTGGGYFPEVSPTSPTAPSLPHASVEDAPTTPTEQAQSNMAPIPSPAAVLPHAAAEADQEFYAQAKAQLPVAPAPSVHPNSVNAPILATPIPAAVSTPIQPPAAYLTDDEAVTMAMKHAKWATSALNFEDVPTAVKELQEALRSLGAL